jgi:N-acetylglucosaminyldiphosphoundecaprenol N-acetyl-beta-D-mannosaminyltransferase
MHDARKRNVLGIMMDAVNYQTALDFVFEAAREKRGAAISALAVHGLMTGTMDREQKFRLNHFDLLLPDGQPVRWALNWLHNAQLSDRVYGPKLTDKICERAAQEGVPVYFYGSTPEILEALRKKLELKYPQLPIAGMEPSKFRRLTSQEKPELAARIRESGAAITFVGLGCPRQEIFAFEFRPTDADPGCGRGVPLPGRQGAAGSAVTYGSESGWR